MIARHAAALHQLLRGPAVLVAVLAVIAAPDFSRAAEPDPSAVLGHWIDSQDNVAIEIYPCEEELCAKIAWLRKSYYKSGEFRRDKKNPDPALRRRPWCGIELVRGLKPRSDTFWSRGQFYYVKKGKTYDLDIELKEDDQLEFRAYLGFRLFGKSETWSRPDPSQDLACAPDPET